MTGVIKLTGEICVNWGGVTLLAVISFKDDGDDNESGGGKDGKEKRII